MEAAPHRVVTRLSELLDRHQGAQRRFEEWHAAPSEQANDYMRATRQVLALALRSVVSRIDLWLQGESSIEDAHSALGSLLAQPRNNMPFDIARTISMEEIRQVALDVDEAAFRCFPVEQESHVEEEP